jgi:adenylate kinase family enzyme
MKKPFVIIIAGPTGVGKTALVKVIKKRLGCFHLSEDEIARETFPDQYKDLEDYPDKVETVVKQIFIRTRDIFEHKGGVVIDMINLEKWFIEEIRKTFHKHLILKILWPPVETTFERDGKREGWTSGEKTINKYYKKYDQLKPIIGKENYIDNSHQTPEETFEEIIEYSLG